MKSIIGSCRKLNSRLVNLKGALLLTICILFALISAQAAYIVDSHFETTSGTNYYTWTLHNEDQSWGLDGLAVEVHTFDTPLTIAARRGHFAIVRALVAAGADVSLHGGVSQCTAECIARLEGHHDISEFLCRNEKRPVAE